jgi:CBS domain containing-hemolysin-like protein
MLMTVIGSFSLPPSRGRLVALLALWVLSVWFPSSAWAMTGPLVDKAADVLAIVVLVLVPIGGIYLFWIVHILPEKIAEKRHHPQKDAIKTLCLLSLVFGGMLWPIAWLWAYSKPVLYKMAYGTDKHEDYEKEQVAAAGAAPPGGAGDPLARLRRTIGQLAAKGVPAEELEPLKREVAEIEQTLARAKRGQGAG